MHIQSALFPYQNVYFQSFVINDVVEISFNNIIHLRIEKNNAIIHLSGYNLEIQLNKLYDFVFKLIYHLKYVIVT